MIQLIGIFLIGFSVVSMVAAESTENYMWLGVSIIAYIIGVVETFIAPIEGFSEKDWE
jgi:uncharacterized membrane protein